MGRAILTKFFAARDLEISDKILEKTLPHFSKKTVADLFVKVAEGVISRQDVVRAVYPDFREDVAKPIKVKTVNAIGVVKRKKTNHSLPIEGLVSGMAIHYAGCCNPIPGDSIIGIINTGTGVTIHSQTCHNIKHLALSPQRVLDVCWKNEDEIGDEFYATRIRVVVENKAGSLADVTSIIAKKQVNITNIKTTNRSADILEVMIDLQVKNLDHLEEIASALRISKKILEVERE